MAYLDDFFKDSGYGNFYQGTAKNTSGQTYNPEQYGGMGAYNPKQPNNPANIGPGAYRQGQNPALGSYGVQTGGAQRPYSTYLYQNDGQSPQSGYSMTLSDMLKQYYR